MGLYISLCRGSLFSQGSYYLALAEPVFLSVLYVNAFLSSPIQALGVGLVVKGMWGDKCQVFDSPQASNPGGRMLGPTQSAALISHVTTCLISVFSTEHWARNSRVEEMWSR